MTQIEDDEIELTCNARLLFIAFEAYKRTSLNSGAMILK